MYQDASTADRLIRIIDTGLRSTHIPGRVSTLHGVLYLLEANVQEVSRQLVPMMADHLLKTIHSQAQYGSLINKSITSVL